MRPTPDSATDLLVRGLRLGVHVAFALLLAFALVSVSLDGDDDAAPWGIYAVGAALAAVYVAGTAVERRLAVRAGYGASPVIPVVVWAPWLAAVTALWAVLVAQHSAFSYCVFPLFFVVLHLVRPLPAGLAGVGVLLVLLVAALSRGGQAGTGAIVGPSVGAAFSVVVFVVYEALVRDSLAQRRALAELEAARTELAAAHRSAGMAAERDRFAAEVHDTLAQGLNAIVLTARAGLAGADERGALRTVVDLASANLEQAREMFRGATGTAGAGRRDALAEDIEAAVARISSGALNLTVRDERSQEQRAQPVDAEVERFLVLAASSLVSNVTRHAGAGRAVLTVGSPGEGLLAMDVVDDGCGFDRKTTPDGFGLASLSARAQALGGSVVVETEPGEGTAVNVTVPARPTGAGRAAPSSITTPDSP
ncbi:sensor histidine kinase [Falsarthrobacter nasiphocae]|uniref:Oxygen sensor histidine kinase NreB n=1 Tax=Falsarthrobacter nasiphocae TaxID=189863 RepID=A0AAE3YDZ1_9MICC|nr:ATP-binding protein [Falsarthrobacter nasiphocae]MDR6892098.1 signal transduction histidine kinase [Falsarthrobacter nasiphocae]